MTGGSRSRTTALSGETFFIAAVKGRHQPGLLDDDAAAGDDARRHRRRA